MNQGKATRLVKIGSLQLGAGNPILVQSMWKKPLDLPAEEIIRELDVLKEAGCHIMRFAVPKLEDAELLGPLCERAPMPLVADIHFNHKIALRVMDFPIAKIRINPGNIGADWKVKEVIKKAMDKAIPLRIGINSGSLPGHLGDKADRGQAMVQAAEEEINILEQQGFTNALFSLKSSQVDETIAANEIFSRKFDYPLHLGLTEAGPLIPGLIKTTVVFAQLLKQGIGDTIRISLSDSSLKEVYAGHQLLQALDMGGQGLKIISCPTCTRAEFPVQQFLESIRELIIGSALNKTIAVMGCPVNGPGEAKHADLGISGSGRYAIIFKNGQIIRKVERDQAETAFLEEIKKL
ncbi:MAG: flavodoxin-dependent (E)-4-hydroxy-3-methylbut-2-enyl-diphosphate synthase [Spirochaetales bacterium]|nr:flavodoxin-dependent (E)-4-hydroxy-3-methylbut-2-enyl-diphosphate synthase [Spirochaetales bacterium]